ncbi:uncharacterized protein B0T15DRAFT_226838 [Chaetomium strumarium]|uniref:Uncharacterized protein n=1 Tax=Chaetomium strumarium TaxID=1170767 RepID=A0AAJ0GQ19_9PEZI|nr:hypothetical protein B0T15DRAFT_226838 [Chaetomium strumarium]
MTAQLFTSLMSNSTVLTTARVDADAVVVPIPIQYQHGRHGQSGKGAWGPLCCHHASFRLMSDASFMARFCFSNQGCFSGPFLLISLILRFSFLPILSTNGIGTVSQSSQSVSKAWAWHGMAWHIHSRTG